MSLFNIMLHLIIKNKGRGEKNNITKHLLQWGIGM